MEGLYNVRELYPIPEESSQVDVGEMEVLGGEQREGRMEGWTKALFSKLVSMFTILSSLTAFLFYRSYTLGLLHSWTQVALALGGNFVEGELLAAKLMYVRRKTL